MVHTYSAHEVAACVTPDNTESRLCGAVRDLVQEIFSEGVENLATRGSGDHGNGNDAAGLGYYRTRAFAPVETDLAIPNICDELSSSGELRGKGIVVLTHLERSRPDGTKEILLKFSGCVTLEYRPFGEPLKQATLVLP